MDPLARRVAYKFTSGWKPWTDPVTRKPGFSIELGCTPAGLDARANVTQDPGGTWYCRLLLGGSVSAVGDGSTAEEAASKCQQHMIRLLAPMLHVV